MNQVKVVTKGNKATIFINGKEVISVWRSAAPGWQPHRFKVASGPEGANTVAFSDFKLVQP